MEGIKFALIDWISFLIAIIVTLYVITVENPYEKGTNEYESLRLCRIGLALLVWSFASGLVGYAFALTSFILGIIGIVKGRTMYGIMLIIGSVCIPVIGTLYFISGIFHHAIDTQITFSLNLLIKTVLIGLIPGAIAYKKGKNFFVWWFFGAVLFIVALPLVLIIKPDRPKIGQGQFTQPTIKNNSFNKEKS